MEDAEGLGGSMTEDPIGVWHCPGCGAIHYNITPRTDLFKFPVIECRCCHQMFYDPEDAKKEDRKWEAALNKTKRERSLKPTKDGPGLVTKEGRSVLPLSCSYPTDKETNGPCGCKDSESSKSA